MFEASTAKTGVVHVSCFVVVKLYVRIKKEHENRDLCMYLVNIWKHHMCVCLDVVLIGFLLCFCMWFHQMSDFSDYGF